jgi:hypothetical protein
MINESLKNAFQRFWEHTLNKISDVTVGYKEDISVVTAKIDSKANQSSLDELALVVNTKETKGSADTALANAKLYTDSEVDATLASAKSYTDTEVASVLSEAKSYTNTEIAELINGAPTTLDTLGEIATAMAENEDVVEALNEAVGSKANQSDFITLQATVDGKAEKEHIHSNATTSKSGMLSSTDKEKLDNIEPNATNNKITIVRW